MHPSPDAESRLDPAVRALVDDLHHVAIVVADLEEARRTYVDLLGLASDPAPEHVPDQKVNVLVCRAGAQRIELVAPASEDSPVSRFLATRGGGLHHLAYRVPDLDEALERLKAAGVRLIDDHARPGAHGTRVAFLHPSATSGVLTELVEEPLDPEDWSE